VRAWLSNWWPLVVCFAGLALVIYAMAHVPLV
jgi:hypothetical protein